LTGLPGFAIKDGPEGKGKELSDETISSNAEILLDWQFKTNYNDFINQGREYND
jgi:hypothetical protein